MPTGAKARAQSNQEIATLAVRPASSTASRFGASAVRNMEEVTQVAAIAVHIT